MTDNLTTAIVVIIAIIAGAVVGWQIAKAIFTARINALKASLDEGREQLSKSLADNEKHTRETETLKTMVAVETNETIRAQSKLEEYHNRIGFLQDELKNERIVLENVSADLRTATERFTIVKTKYDKLFADNIEMSNEKNRFKDQVEQYRLKENELNKIISTLTAKYEEALGSIREQKVFVEASQKSLKDSFDALSAAALDKNNQSFLDLAKTALESHVTEAKGDLEKRQQAIDGLVRPLGESLTKMDEKINSLESKREGAYGNISALLDQVKLSTLSLDKETKNLVTALKTSHTRGRYGEIALRRLVEFAGMVDQCDFVEQETADTETGRLRPDMIIKLPANRLAVVDSKVPLSAYLKIFETDDTEQQKLLIGQHVSAIKTHIRQLSGKAYWDQFRDAPDFVVLFMQIESSFGAALQAWPELIEEALNNRIIVATPTTLITILRSIGYSWNQLKTMENIEEIRDAAVELYERSAVLIDHMAGMGRGLQGTVAHYNKVVGSLESNFLPQGRKIQSLSQAYVKKQLQDIGPIEITVRPVNESNRSPLLPD
jgi:DNA recombination protein RmuC